MRGPSLPASPSLLSPAGSKLTLPLRPRFQQGETELCARLVNLVARFGLVPLDDIPLPTESFLLPPHGTYDASDESGSNSDDGGSADEDGSRSAESDDDDDDFVPRRAGEQGARKGVLLDFESAGGPKGGDRRDDDEGEDEQEEEDEESEEEEDDDDKWAHERGTADGDDDQLAATPALDFTPSPPTPDDPDAAAAATPSSPRSEDLPMLDDSADPSSTGSSPVLANGSPPTPADSPEPDVDARRKPKKGRP